MLDSTSTKGSTVLHAIAITIAIGLLATLQPQLSWKSLTTGAVAPGTLKVLVHSPQSALPGR